MRQPIELADLGRDAVEMMAPIAMKAASSLLLGNFPSAIVRVDYSQMLRVLGNLIGNALKYSPAGSCVELAGRRTDGIVELTVTDHGVGMYESEVARAFDHGWQGVDGQARGDGAGLGLAIVKSLVEQQNGTVAIASTPGVGTVVTITLPCW